MNLIEHKVKQTPSRIFGSVALGAALLSGTCASGTSLGLNPVLAQESNQSDHAPSGWFLAGSKPASYRTGVDKQMSRDALPSAYLVSTVQDVGGFGTLMQSIKAINMPVSECVCGRGFSQKMWLAGRDCG
jgi:hypothetical protein